MTLPGQKPVARHLYWLSLSLSLSLSAYVWIDISRQARPHQTQKAPFLEWACGVNLMTQDEIEIAALKLDNCSRIAIRTVSRNLTITGVI